MSEEKKKTNFFKEALKSIKDLDKYEDFALEKPGTAFKYFLKMLLIFCIIISIFYTYKIVDNMKDIYSNMQNKLPEFSYSQGELKFNSEDAITIEDDKDSFGNIVIDTNASEDKVNEYKKDKKISLLFLNDKFILLNGNVGQVEYKYSDIFSRYNITEFTKQDIINYANGINIVYICFSIYFIIFVYLFALYFISIFIDVLILSLLAMIISRLSRIKLKYAPSFNIAIHSITLPIILNLIYIVVNLLTGFNVKYFQAMYNAIGYIYVIVGVLMIKTDFINRQIELMKIAQEQEKIKEELKKQEKEPVEEDNKKENKEEKDSNSSKRKKEENKDGENLEGTVGDASIVPEDK